MFSIQTNSKGNVTILRIARMEFLFSYATFVAFEDCEGSTYRTGERYSITTTRHIGTWLDGRQCTVIPAQVWRDWRDTFVRKFGAAIGAPQID